MSKKEKFIEEVENLMFEAHKNLSEEAMIYFEALKGQTDAEKPAFTENGKAILKYFQANPDIKIHTAKSVGEGMGISSKTVSGAMRKLSSDGYVEKLGNSPAAYSITEKGLNITFEEE